MSKLTLLTILSSQCMYEGSEERHLAVLFHRKVQLQRGTLLIINVSPKVECLLQILNVSLYNLWESLSAEHRHFSLHLVVFSWLSRESAVTIGRSAKIKLFYKVMYACVSFSLFFFVGNEAHSAISLGRAPNQGGITISIWSPLSGDNFNLYLRHSAASYPYS